MSLLIGLVIAGAAAVWVHQDAKKRGIDGFYAIATFLVLIIGLPLYLIERGKHPEKTGVDSFPSSPSPGAPNCPNCHGIIVDEAKNCPHCGFPLK